MIALCAALPPCSSSSRQRLKPNCSGSIGVLLDLAIAQLGYFGRTTERDFIKTFQTVHNHGPRAAEILEHMGDHGDKLPAINADQLMRRHRRVGQRPENIEDGAYADIAPRLHRIFHRLMKQRRKQKSDADFCDALLDPFLGRIHFDAQSAQHVGAARLTRNRPIAMLRDIDPGAGKHECRGRRDVESSLLIAARPAGIEDGFGSDIYPMSLFAHHPRRAGNLVDRFPLHAQGREEQRPPATASLPRS